MIPKTHPNLIQSIWIISLFSSSMLLSRDMLQLCQNLILSEIAAKKYCGVSYETHQIILKINSSVPKIHLWLKLSCMCLYMNWIITLLGNWLSTSVLLRCSILKVYLAFSVHQAFNHILKHKYQIYNPQCLYSILVFFCFRFLIYFDPQI